MEYKYSSFDMGMSYFDNKKYNVISRGLEKVLEGLGLEDLKVVCRETIINDFPEKERFQIIIGKKSAEWEEILKES